MNGLFTSPTGIIALIVTAAILGWGLKLILQARPRKEVLFLRPRDRRGEVLEVTRETDRSLICEKSNPLHRFIKTSPGYTFVDRGKAVTRFWGIEGTVYTAIVKGGKEIKMELTDFLRDAWGKAYDKMPEKMKQAIKNVGVLVEPVPITPQEYGLPTLSSDEINDEADAIMLSRLAHVAKPETRREFYQMLIGIGLGVGLALVLIRWGVL